MKDRGTITVILFGVGGIIIILGFYVALWLTVDSIVYLSK